MAEKYAVKEILLRGVKSPDGCEFEKAMKRSESFV